LSSYRLGQCCALLTYMCLVSGNGSGDTLMEWAVTADTPWTRAALPGKWPCRLTIVRPPPGKGGLGGSAPSRGREGFRTSWPQLAVWSDHGVAGVGRDRYVCDRERTVSCLGVEERRPPFPNLAIVTGIVRMDFVGHRCRTRPALLPGIHWRMACSMFKCCPSAHMLAPCPYSPQQQTYASQNARCDTARDVRQCAGERVACPPSILCVASILSAIQVDGEVVSSIGPGLLCLIGVKDTDTQKDADYMCVPSLCRDCWCWDRRAEPTSLAETQLQKDLTHESISKWRHRQSLGTGCRQSSQLGSAVCNSSSHVFRPSGCCRWLRNSAR
jgi:hypothetical protein